MQTRQRRLFELQGKLERSKRKVEETEKIIKEALGKSNNPYVAFSTGKDSTVVLHLVRQIDNNIPAVYLDAECAYPESQELLKNTSNLIKYPAKEPFLETIRRHGLFNPKIEQITMETTVYYPIRHLLDEYGFDCVFLGLRAEESKGRRMLYRNRGKLFFNKRDGISECLPVADWSYRDIWAYIVRNNIEYCKVYDKLWGMPEENQRLSYWAGESERQNGRYFWLNKHYPELFRKLSKICPEIRRFI